MVVTRGKIHNEVMGGDWTQTGDGMAAFVARLPSILKARLGPSEPWPRVLFSDRGSGLFQSSTGHIVRAYADALKAHGFRTYQGEDASEQPADLAEVFPHETAAAWTRKYMQKHHLDRRGSLDVQEACLRASLKACAHFVNTHYYVTGLCARFPNRWRELVARSGDRLDR